MSVHRDHWHQMSAISLIIHVCPHRQQISYRYYSATILCIDTIPMPYSTLILVATLYVDTYQNTYIIDTTLMLYSHAV